MDLRQIYKPIRGELKKVEGILRHRLGGSQNKSIVELCNFLLTARGKMIRPALVIFSAKITNGSDRSRPSSSDLFKIASAMELIHMASLIHDDIIDRADLRHNKPTVNYKWGQDVSIALGDYLYSLAFELLSHCANTDILQCISSAAKAMCEGELVQVCRRDNVNILKERYMVMVKKKTASLFAASCQAGALVSGSSRAAQAALRDYGMNFGITFQIVDDYLDFVGEKRSLGKRPGQDIRVGEVTLPMIDLLESLPRRQQAQMKKLFLTKQNRHLW